MTESAERKLDWNSSHPQYDDAKNANNIISKYGPFTYNNMVAIYTYPDGSCLIHAILNGFWVPYRTGKLGTQTINRREYVKEVRDDIAKYLESKESLKSINTIKNDEKKTISDQPDIPYYANLMSPRVSGTSSNKTVYEQLANGNLLDLSKHADNMKLEALQEALRSTNSIEGDVMFEALINYFNVNIFVLDEKAFDVSLHASANEKLRLNDASCIVLLHLSNHYELVGIRDGMQVHTYFKLDNAFIKAILSRINLLKTGNQPVIKNTTNNTNIPSVPRRKYN